MILTHTTHTGPDNNRIKQAYKELCKEAVYVGEDGVMVCGATTELGALLKFKRLVTRDCGKEEANDLTLADVGVGYLFVLDPTNPAHKEMMLESDWFVSWRRLETSDYPVYVMNN